MKGNIPSIYDNRILLIKGLFQETLDLFLQNYYSENRMVIHLDCDLYASTLYVLTRLHDQLFGLIFALISILVLNSFILYLINSIISNMFFLSFCIYYGKEFKLTKINKDFLVKYKIF